jgi:hypothetical protein
MTYSVLMGLASQRQEQIAARARRPVPSPPATRAAPRPHERDRARGSLRLLALVGRS